jgi:hypothetical protein
LIASNSGMEMHLGKQEGLTGSLGVAVWHLISRGEP